MQLLAIQAAMTLVVVATVLLPGWSIAVLVGARGGDAPTELRRAWIVLYGLGWASVATAIALVLGAPRLVAALLVLAPVVPGGAWALRRGVRPTVPARATVLVHAWAMLVAALVGAWGTTFRSDGTYHAAAVEKLTHLNGVTPGAMSLFGDGEPIAALLVPAWHQLLSVAAQVLHVEFAGLVAVWSSAGAAAWLVVLVAGAGGRVATGRCGGAWAATVLTPLVLLAPLGGSAPLLKTLGYPGNVVLFAVLPALLATVAWRAGADAPLGPRRAWIAAIVLGTLAIGALHVTYAYFLALVGLGMLVAAALLDRGAVRRLAGPALVAAATLLVAVAAQLPVLAGHQEFGRGSEGSQGALVRHTWTDVLSGDGFAIRGSWFLAQGTVFTAGLLATALVIPLVRRRRLEAVLLTVVPVLVLGSLARCAPFAEMLSGLGSFPPVPRTPRMLPAALSLVVVASAVDSRFALRRRTVAVAAGAITGLGLAAWAMLARAGRIGEDLGAGHHGLLPGAVFDALLIVLAIELVLTALRARPQRESSSPGAALPCAPGASRGGFSRGLVVTLLVVGVVAWGADAVDEVQSRPPHITQAEGLADGDVFDRDWFSVVRRVEPRSVVLADPRVSLRVAAVAPVYVTSTAKNQLTDPKREKALQQFMDPATDEDARLAYLEDQGVDVIAFPARRDFLRAVSALLEGDSGWHAYRTSGRLRLYCRGGCEAIPADWRGDLREIQFRPG